MSQPRRAGCVRGTPAVAVLSAADPVMVHGADPSLRLLLSTRLVPLWPMSLAAGLRSARGSHPPSETRSGDAPALSVGRLGQRVRGRPAPAKRFCRAALLAG